MTHKTNVFQMFNAHTGFLWNFILISFSPLQWRKQLQYDTTPHQNKRKPRYEIRKTFLCLYFQKYYLVSVVGVITLTNDRSRNKCLTPSLVTKSALWDRNTTRSTRNSTRSDCFKLKAKDKTDCIKLPPPQKKKTNK